MADVAWAQAAGGAAAQNPLVSFFPLILIFVVFYFLLIRPQQQKQKEHDNLLANLKKNDEVITNGGLYGKVYDIKDQIIVLEIAPNLRVRQARAQIASVLTAPGAADKGKDEKSKEDKGSKQ
jgi:preprotein translocase subunit YajC